MAGYIKTHSNYRLQTRHQVVNDGVILERDISTVGGVDSFASGQATVYQSGNFVIVVNNSSPASRHVRNSGWLPSGSDDDTWTENNLAEHSSDVNGSVESKITLKNDFMDLRSFAYYGSLSDLVQNTVAKIITTFPYELYYEEGLEDVTVSGQTYTRISNPGLINIYNTVSRNNLSSNELGYFYNGGYANYEISLSGETGWSEWVNFEWESEPSSGSSCPIPGQYVATIAITPDSDNEIAIYAYWDNNLNVEYLTDNDKNFRIRPKLENGYYEDFIDNLDMFGKCLMGTYSGIKNTSKFEVLREGERGTRRELQTFVLPTGVGAYNIMTSGLAMEDYVSRLGNIALTYDNQYTDNLLRLMTHDSLKNLDWTSYFNGNDGDYDNEYIKNGEKFASVIRLMGYTFDQKKTYIDSIGNVNTVTYSNRDNLSDYFLTDSLETDGWVVNTIYPYNLTEYNSSGDTVSDWSAGSQKNNEYARKFSENTATVIRPWDTPIRATYVRCNGSLPEEVEISGYTGQSYVVEDGKVYNVITNYLNDTEVTIPEVNNEFIKRFKINSKYILRKKGTIGGIESVLALFGLKSRKWCEERYPEIIEEILRGSGDTANLLMFDYDIQEKTAYTPPFYDTMDNVHMMYKMDWYNSCKTIPYNTQSYINGIYIPYQGLPVAYREVEEGGITRRKLYPHFSQNGIYDGNMYYQMNGGWLGYYPFMYTQDDEIFMDPARIETLRNILQVKNITELLNQPTGDLFEDIIYYVNDLSENFAIINGMIYPLIEEYDASGNTKYYFEVSVYGGSVSIGGELYTDIITVSNRDGGESIYDLSVYKDSSVIRIYYTGDSQNPFIIKIGTYSPENITIFKDGCYELNNQLKDCHYFILKNIDYPDLLGDGYWEQIPKNTHLYRKIENIVDKTLGNNPHSAANSYDSGQEYINRFKKLFKYASENSLFDESCFVDVESAYNEIDSYGFNVREIYDSKIHSFTDSVNEGGVEKVYDINDRGMFSGMTDYNSFATTEGMDGSQQQIINMKKVNLTFYLGTENLYTKDGQEQVKYIQNKIMPWVEQMIPSTLILNVDIKTKKSLFRIFDETFDDTFN